jgi:eukaryotic-like serine/threonine-protein kinase
MKKHLFFILILLASLYSCSKESEPDYFFPSEPDRVITILNSSFDSLNTDMTTVANAIAFNTSDTASIRSNMLGLFNRSTFVMEFAFVTPGGIMEVVEPSVYHYIEGANISMQDHVVQCYQTKKPVLSNMFYAVEDFYATVDMHPVLNQDALQGGITALFRPQTILKRIIDPLVKNQLFEIWVMEKGGVVLFDQDTMEIGRNVITDTLYKPFPELIAAARLIDSAASGETSYSFYQTGTSIKVFKRTYWKTFELYGTSWKIIWVKPE